MKISGVLLNLIWLSVMNKAVAGDVKQFVTTLVPFFNTWNQLFTTSDQSQSDRENTEEQGECSIYVDSVIDNVLDLIHESPQLFIDHNIQTTEASGITSHSTSYVSSVTQPTTAKFKQVKPAERKNCQTDFILLGDHCYYFSTQGKSWHDALGECKNLGAELAHPLTSEENSLLVNYFSINHKNETWWWIGGTDEDKEGEWVWAHDKSLMTYTDWSPSEPNDSYGQEDCLHYFSVFHWKWNDDGCHRANAFICQN